MSYKSAFAVPLAILMVASVGLSAHAQVTTPPTTCAAPPAPPETLMITMPTPPADPPCGDRCSKSVVNKYNQDVQAFNDAAQKATDDYSAYQRKLLDFSRTVSDYSNCEINRINRFMSDVMK